MKMLTQIGVAVVTLMLSACGNHDAPEVSVAANSTDSDVITQGRIDAVAAMRQNDCRIVSIDWHFVSYPGLSLEDVASLRRFGVRPLLELRGQDGGIDEAAVNRAATYGAAYNDSIRAQSGSYHCNEWGG